MSTSKRRHRAFLTLFGYCRINMSTFLEDGRYNNDVMMQIFNFYYIPLILSMIDFKCNKSELLQTKKIYELQCSHLSSSEKQKGLWRVLTLSRKNRLPLFPLILDSFMRDRLNYYYQTKKSLSSMEWTNNYKTISNLVRQQTKKETSSDIPDILKGSIDTFGARYATFLSIKDIEELYDDSLNSFVSWIIEATSFINSLITTDQIAPPFQVPCISM